MKMTAASYSVASSGNIFAFTATDLFPLSGLIYSQLQGSTLEKIIYTILKHTDISTYTYIYTYIYIYINGKSTQSYHSNYNAITVS